MKGERMSLVTMTTMIAEATVIGSLAYLLSRPGVLSPDA
jgi:hypothetical protein